MKNRLYNAKSVLFTLSVIPIMGMTACSFVPKEGTAAPIVEVDIVENTYRGAMGDEEHPGEAVKVISASENDDNTSNNENEILAYITDLDADKISIDVVEWVMVPGSRADELGINEEDGASGFYIYNPDTLVEQFTLSADCMITVLDWQNSFEPKTISADDFIAVLQERGEQNNFIPYSLKATNSTITEISEHYVP